MQMEQCAPSGNPLDYYEGQPSATDFTSDFGRDELRFPGDGVTFLYRGTYYYLLDCRLQRQCFGRTYPNIYCYATA